MGKTSSQLTTLIAGYLKRADITNAQLLDFLNMAVHNLERKYNWKFMKTRSTVDLVSGDYLVSNPLKRYKSIQASAVIDANGQRWPITKVAPQTTIEQYDDFTNDVGRPEVFSEYELEDTTSLSIGTAADTKVKFATAPFIGTDSNIHTYAAQEVALAAATVPSNKWGAWRFCVNNAGTFTCVGASANGTTGYADEATAIAAIPAIPANYSDVGYITILTKVGSAFVAGTDSLAGGATGNVASVTNYYASDVPAITQLLIRPTSDAAYTLDFFGYQYSPDLDGAVYTANWWTQNAWEILLYAALLEAQTYIIGDERINTWKYKLYGDGNETVPKGALGDLLRAERDEEYGESFLTIGQGQHQARLKDSLAYIYGYGD